MRHVIPGGWEESLGVDVGSSRINDSRMKFLRSLIEDVQTRFKGTEWDGSATVEDWVEASSCSCDLGVTSCPPSRTPYTHDVRIFYISSLSMLFDICEQCWYQRCVTSIEIGGDVLALGIRFI